MTPLFAHGIVLRMTRKPWPLLLAALAIAGQACNLQRVLDPSLPTLTPQPSATAIASPTTPATSLPTLTNEARVESGDLLFFYGDWDAALREYQSVLNNAQNDELRAAALLGIGRCYIEKDNLPEAREALETLIGTYPGTQAVAGAYFALAQVVEAYDDAQAAADAYANYLKLRPGIIDSYVREWQGDQLAQAGDFPAAISAYEQAAAAPRLGDPSLVRIKLGNAQANSGDFAAAIATYQSIFDSTINEYLKADLDLLIGRAYLAQGDAETAYTYFQHAVTNYPLAYSSYAALVDLVNAGQDVDLFQRGFIDYNVATLTTDQGEQRDMYGLAIAAFERYLTENPDNHDDSAHYYRALAFRAVGNYGDSLEEWDQIIEEHAFDTHWVEAYSEKAATQWLYMDDYDGAIETLLGFVASTPSQPASAEFLFTAGRIAEGGGQLTRSVEIWPRVANEYPDSEFAYDAVFLAGISAYRLEDYVQAQSLFLRAYQSALSLEEESQSLFWVAKALQAQGDEEAARNAWQQAAAADPTGYYSERAADILEGKGIFQSPANYSFEYDIEAERREAEGWIRSTFDLDPATDLSSLGPLAGDTRLQRGTELWRLGEYELARAEFEDLRQALTTDPANSYRLANYLVDLGLYRTGVFAAREVLTLAGMSDAATMNAPKYFNRIRFGTYFRELVLPQTARNNLDPLFFFSMMRQESLYEGFVTSSAGARGLMQIIPVTGQEVADLSGWPPNFTPDDLYRPAVSIRLGADYLAMQAHAYDGDMYAALAAYNAGAGNASHWLGLAGDDPDLFLEVVSFAETRNHIRSVYELFTIYSDLYATEAE